MRPVQQLLGKMFGATGNFVTPKNHSQLSTAESQLVDLCLSDQPQSFSTVQWPDRHRNEARCVRRCFLGMKVISPQQKISVLSLMRHDAVRVVPPDPRVEIDREIVGLIRQCWRLGLSTRTAARAM